MNPAGAIAGMEPLGLLFAVVLAALAIVWLLAAFALFGLKRRIDALRAELVKNREMLAAEQRRTNELLGRLLGHLTGPTAGEPPAERGGLRAAPRIEPDEPPAAPRRPLVARRD